AQRIGVERTVIANEIAQPRAEILVLHVALFEPETVRDEATRAPPLRHQRLLVHAPFLRRLVTRPERARHDMGVTERVFHGAAGGLPRDTAAGEELLHVAGDVPVAMLHVALEADCAAGTVYRPLPRVPAAELVVVDLSQ